jgi:hypothetical protein
MLQPHKSKQLIMPNVCAILSTKAYKYSEGRLLVQKKTKSLLEELNDYAVKKDRESVLEARATHIIDSAVNLLQLIRENFDTEAAYELERRFINSIKGADSAKFVRGIRKLRDSKETAKTLRIIEGDVDSDD